MKAIAPTLNWAFQDVNSILKYVINNTVLLDSHPLRQMMRFVESSDMGKLYLNYPMVETFYHMSDIPDAAFLTRIATLQELAAGRYKARVNQENRNGDYTKFATTKEECSIVIAQNLQKAWGASWNGA